MTKKNLFEWDEYKGYLRQSLDDQGARSGRRAAFAKALGCQSSFISQVLHTATNLSLEQACKTNDFLEHTPEQAHFFMLLVQLERAGSVDLRKYFQTQIESIVSERQKFKNRLVPNYTLTEAQQSIYYSRPEFALVHMAIAVPGNRTAKDISHNFRMPLKRVEEVLQFLISTGMAELINNEYRIGHVHMHLPADSPFIHQHHANWRLEAMRRMDPANTNHIHYSSVMTLSKKDLPRIRENLRKVVEDNLVIVRPSPEEVVVAQMIDLVVLGES